MYKPMHRAIDEQLVDVDAYYAALGERVWLIA